MVPRELHLYNPQLALPVAVLFVRPAPEPDLYVIEVRRGRSTYQHQLPGIHGPFNQEELEQPFAALLAQLHGEGYLRAGTHDALSALGSPSATIRARAALRPRTVVGAAGPEQIRRGPDRLAHDLRYSLDDGKIRAELGYAPRVDFATGIAEVVDWYRKHEGWWRPAAERCSAQVPTPAAVKPVQSAAEVPAQDRPSLDEAAREADRIRALLGAQGVALEDRPDGRTEWRRA